MAPKDEKSLYDTLSVGTDVPAADDDFTLEEILAEYGGSRGQVILRAAEQEKSAPEAKPEQPPAKKEPVSPTQLAAPKRLAQPLKPDPAETERLQQEARNKLLAQAVDLEKLEKEIPREPRPITLEEVVGSTVDAVMGEREPIMKPKRGLFSRKRMEETEELYARPEKEVPEMEEREVIEFEPETYEAAADFREEHRSRRGALPLAMVLALLPTIFLAAEEYGVVIPYWSGDAKFQSLALLICLLLVAVLCRQVFIRGVEMLLKRRCTSELLISLSAVVCVLDCAARLVLAQRTAVMPYASVSCLALVFALWGCCEESRGFYDTFHVAAMDDEPPYLVTETEKGACKQKGAVPGFYTTAARDNTTVIWQTVLLPLVLVASIVFAGLTSLGQDRGSDFLLNWSAILSAGATFALPLCWGLPWAKLTRRLQKVGCALAGWSGAERISRRKSIIVTDMDLFPPGTMQLNGIKVYGEELKKAVSYAASMARSAACGLERLFDGLLRSELGQYEKVDDFSFYKEGGYSATIHGESVLLGTASFMRKMSVRLPGDITLKTGIFLAVDRELTAVFAVKYKPSENVDFALRMLRRSGITPILASRDPNITPALLKRKFHKRVKVEYPDLTERVALSEAEKDRGMPRALLFREGLLPYADTVAGSCRLCGTVRRAVILSLVGSAAGTLLAAYMASLSAYSLMSPLALEVFLLLWTLPVLLMADWTGRY